MSLPAAPVDGFAPERVIIRSPNPLGDACMSLPAIRAIRRAWKSASLVVTCRENLAPMWESQREVDVVIPFPKKANPISVGMEIRSHGEFDLGILLPNSFRSALELRCGGVSNLAGFKRYQRGFLLNRAVREPKPDVTNPHHANRYLYLVEQLGVAIDEDSELFQIPPAPRPIPRSPGMIHIGVCPGAEYGNAKRYPIERYAEAIEKLRERKPNIAFTVSIFGSPAEREIGEQLAALLSDPVENRAGETSVGELVDELRDCHFVATNDTGTMHLAAALGVPTVAIFGSTEPAFTAPIGEIHRVIRHKVDCSPCFLRECPIDYRCMLRIEPNTVTDEMEGLLAEAGSSL